MVYALNWVDLIDFSLFFALLILLLFGMMIIFHNLKFGRGWKMLFGFEMTVSNRLGQFLSVEMNEGNEEILI